MAEPKDPIASIRPSDLEWHKGRQAEVINTVFDISCSMHPACEERWRRVQQEVMSILREYYKQLKNS